MKMKKKNKTIMKTFAARIVSSMSYQITNLHCQIANISCISNILPLKNHKEKSKNYIYISTKKILIFHLVIIL